ncbi:MAG: CHAT domain-containing protein [Bacteroidetes bacterium]|nr:MAG: CHAT domain-containing protein [Bacteroidota bacterium]
MKKLIIVLILLGALQALAQQQCDSLKATAYAEKAVEFLKNELPDSSEWYRKKAEALFRTCDYLGNWIQLRKDLGVVYRNNAQFERAIAWFRSIQDDLWQKPRNTDEYKKLVWVYADIGYSYQKLNQYQSTREYYDKARSLYLKEVGGEDPVLAHYIYSELGNAYNRLRDYEQADIYLRRRKDILLEAGKWDGAAGALNDLGIVYTNEGQYQEAADIFSEGLALPDVGFENKVYLMTNLGFALMNTGELEAGLQYTRRCEEYIRNAPVSEEDKTDLLIWVYDNLRELYQEKGDYESAEQYYALKNRLIQQSLSGNRRALALSLITRGRMYLDWGKPQQALQDFHNALQYFMPGFTPDSSINLPDAEMLSAEPNLVDALGGLARSLAIRYHHAPSEALADKVSRCYALASMVEELLLHQYILEDAQFFALQDHRWVKAQNLSFTYDRWSKNNRDAAMVEQMFAISEKSRAALLWEGMEASRTFDTEDIGGIRNAFDSLNRKIERLEQMLHDSVNPESKTSLDVLKLEKRNALAERKTLLDRVKEELPEADFARQRIPIAISDLLQQLHKDQALVEYFIEESEAFIFVVDPQNEKAAVLKTDWDEEWSDMAATLMEDIIQQNHEAYTRKARALYQHLVAPILKVSSARNLTIIPDGVLWKVPFSVLLTEDETGSSFKDFHYLIREYTLNFGFSATLQQEMSHKSQSSSGKPLMAFAPSYRDVDINSTGSLLNPLKAAAGEAKAIAEQMDGIYIIGDRASKQRFLQAIMQASVLHIAAHAKSDPENPNFSFIAFSNTGDTLGQSFKLYAHELYNQTMPQEMIVLSACETGTGTVRSGEGIISLARAFAYSGTKSIVYTLWNVNDDASKKIMQSFYENLHNGMPKDKALQMAQVAYINDAPSHGHADPLLWAAYTPIGNMEPLYNSPLSAQLLLFGGLLIGALIGAGWYWRRKQKYSSV